MSKIQQAIKNAEKTLGFSIDKETADEVLQYSKRKCHIQGQDKSYLPILFENELTDYFFRLAITINSERRSLNV